MTVRKIDGYIYTKRGRERGLLNFSGSGLYSVLDLGSKEIQEFSFGSVTVMSYDSSSTIGLLI
jgi:hypothetical protein